MTTNRKWQYLVNPQFSCSGNSVDAPCPTVIARQDKLPLQIASVSTETEHLPSFIKKEGDSLIYIAYDTDSPILSCNIGFRTRLIRHSKFHARDGLILCISNESIICQ